MKELTISTNAPKAVTANKKPEGWSHTATINFPETVEEAVAEFGEVTVFDLFEKQYKVWYQGAVRRLAEAGEEDETIDARLMDAKPGDTIRVEGDPMTKVLAKFHTMSAEQRAAFMAQLAAAQE